MKRLISKYGHMLSAFALVMTVFMANRACGYIFHQPKMPESAKQLRKF